MALYSHLAAENVCHPHRRRKRRNERVWKRSDRRDTTPDAKRLFSLRRAIPAGAIAQIFTTPTRVHVGFNPFIRVQPKGFDLHYHWPSCSLISLYLECQACTQNRSSVVCREAGKASWSMRREIDFRSANVAIFPLFLFFRQLHAWQIPTIVAIRKRFNAWTKIL